MKKRIAFIVGIILFGLGMGYKNDYRQSQTDDLIYYSLNDTLSLQKGEYIVFNQGRQYKKEDYFYIYDVEEDKIIYKESLGKEIYVKIKKGGTYAIFIKNQKNVLINVSDEIGIASGESEMKIKAL